MALPIRFNLKDLEDLSEDLKQSPKALSVIVQRVLSQALRRVRSEQAPLAPGRTRRALRVTVRRSKVERAVVARYGFLPGRGVPARSIIAANVLQKPGAQARKSQYLWIPTPANQNVTPRDFFGAENTFIRTTSGGNKVAFVRHGDQAIPLFVLKRNVQLKHPPLPIDQRVESEIPVISQEILDTVAQVIEARKAAVRALAS